MKTLISLLLMFLLSMASIASAASCEEDVRDESRDTLKKYVDTINAKDPDKAVFGRTISSNLISIANCERVALPVTLADRRGYYQGVVIIMQYAGLDNAAARPTLRSVDESYNRLILQSRQMPKKVGAK